MSDWSADVCSSDRIGGRRIEPGIARTLMLDIEEGECFEIATDFAGVIDRAGEGPARDEGRAAPAGAPHELEIVRQSAVGISDAAAKREPFGGAPERFEFQTLDIRSEDRRVGNEWVRPWRSRWTHDH